MKKNVLFLCWDGMTDPLGQSQVIPYLQGLSKEGYQFTLISVEKKVRYKRDRAKIEKLMLAGNIDWRPIMYTRYPPFISRLYDKWRMKRSSLKLHREKKIDLIHCRSFIGADVGKTLHRRAGVPFLYDMRGFWVDERIDNGQWDLKKPFFRFVYKRYKKLEKEHLFQAAHIISLTEKAKSELIHHYAVPASNITVIPCCVDMSHFDYTKISKEDIVDEKKKAGISLQDKVLCYLGSIGGWYLSKEMLDFFVAMKKKVPRLKFLFITQENAASIIVDAVKSGADEGDIVVRSASRDEVPLYIALSDWSIFFIKPGYSKMASSPTKQGEIMAMGIPIICNDVGDTSNIIESSRTGIVVHDFSDGEYNRVADQVESVRMINREQIRQSAFEYYDLQKGTNKYSLIYKAIIG